MNGEYIMDNYDPYNFSTEEEYYEFWETEEEENKTCWKNSLTWKNSAKYLNFPKAQSESI